MKITKLNVPYAQVPNELLCDPAVSFKAKGLWSYIQSKPNDYDFSAERIADETADGVDSIKTALQELEDKGYLVRKRLQSGRVDYVLTFPKVENPTGGKSLRGKTPRISKKDISKDIEDNKVIITYGAENPTGVQTPEIVTTRPADDTQTFFSMVQEGAEAFQVFVSQMSSKTKMPPAFVAEELKLFTLYWTEKNHSGKKEKWQGEKTFEVRRRLVTWFNNKRTNFGRNKGASMNGVENKYQVDFSKK